ATERLLVDRIAACWLATLHAEQRLANAAGQSLSLPLARFYAEEAERQHKRLLKSIEALAKVRRLLAPTQINVALPGGQQVNVGSVALGSAGQRGALAAGDGIAMET